MVGQPECAGIKFDDRASRLPLVMKTRGIVCRDSTLAKIGSGRELHPVEWILLGEGATCAHRHNAAASVMQKIGNPLRFVMADLLPSN